MSNRETDPKSSWTLDLETGSREQEDPAFSEESFLKSIPQFLSTGGETTSEIDPRSGFILSWIDGKKKVSEIFAVAGMSRREAIQRLRDLFQNGLIDFGNDTKQVEGFLGRYGQVLSEAEKQEIRHTWARMERGDNISILGLKPGATPEKIRQAYWELSRRFHPDRYSGREMGEYRRFLEEINVRITKAYHELRMVSKGSSGADETARSLLDLREAREKDKENVADVVFKEAERALKLGNVKAAFAKAHLAVSLQPKNSRYRDLFLRLETLLHASRSEGRGGGKGGTQG